MKKFNESDVKIELVSKSDIDTLAHSLTKWHKTPWFMDFLKEAPMSFEENKKMLESKLNWQEAHARIILFKNRVAGIIILHSLDEKKWVMEESIRICPEHRGKWLGTELKKEAVKKALEIPWLNWIESWHSAWNKWTFWNNKHLGKIVDFVPDQTWLQNISKQTDDFKWLLDWKWNESGTLIICEKNREKILAWLEKHWIKSV